MGKVAKRERKGKDNVGMFVKNSFHDFIHVCYFPVVKEGFTIRDLQFPLHTLTDHEPTDGEAKIFKFWR